MKIKYKMKMKYKLFLLLLVMVPHPLQTAVQVSPTCSRALGLEDGSILDSQLTASSSYQPRLVGAANARLNTERGGGAWCPKSLISGSPETQEFVEINLGTDHVISSVLTQGRFANGLGQEYAEFIQLYFARGNDGEFRKYSSGSGSSVFAANTNTFQHTQINITRVVVAARVRIVPVSEYPRTICMRIELKGCPYPGNFFSLLMNESLGAEEAGPWNQKVQQLGDQGEGDHQIYLAVSIGVLVTAAIASVAAVCLVLYRSRREQRTEPVVSSYNNFSTADSQRSDPAGISYNNFSTAESQSSLHTKQGTNSTISQHSTTFAVRGTVVSDRLVDKAPAAFDHLGVRGSAVYDSLAVRGSAVKDEGKVGALGPGRGEQKRIGGWSDNYYASRRQLGNLDNPRYYRRPALGSSAFMKPPRSITKMDPSSNSTDPSSHYSSDYSEHMPSYRKTTT